MTPRRRRLLVIVFAVLALGAAVALVMNAFRSNLVFFFSPTEVHDGTAPRSAPFRVGGLVREGSVVRDAQSLTIRFVVTDRARDLDVEYTGLLPDLFREGQGVVAQGKLGADGRFVASQVLAKHDENYMPPEAAEALARSARTVVQAEARP